MKVNLFFFFLSFVFVLTNLETKAQNVQQRTSTCVLAIDDSKNPEFVKEDLRMQLEKVNEVKSCKYDSNTKTYLMEVNKDFREVDVMKVAQKNQMGIKKIETKY